MIDLKTLVKRFFPDGTLEVDNYGQYVIYTGLQKPGAVRVINDTPVEESGVVYGLPCYKSHAHYYLQATRDELIAAINRGIPDALREGRITAEDLEEIFFPAPLPDWKTVGDAVYGTVGFERFSGFEFTSYNLRAGLFIYRKAI